MHIFVILLKITKGFFEWKQLQEVQSFYQKNCSNKFFFIFGRSDEHFITFQSSLDNMTSAFVRTSNQMAFLTHIREGCFPLAMSVKRCRSN